MSHWRAYAAASDVPDADLRRKYVEALETLYAVAEALDCAPNEGAMVQSIEEAQLDAEEAREACEKAEDRLEKLLQAQTKRGIRRLSEANEQLMQERNEALERLAKVEPLIDSYSDLLATARRFVTTGEEAGVKVRHVRKVKGLEKKRKAQP